MNKSNDISGTTLDRSIGILFILAFCAGMVAAALSFQVGDYNIDSSETGIAFLGLGGFFYGLVLTRSKAVPKALGWLGILSGILIAAGVRMARFDANLFIIFSYLATPFGIWQLALGLWLLIRGPKDQSQADKFN